MLDNTNTVNPKIHSYVYAFCFFISLTLYQTGMSGRGTLLAFVSIFLTLVLLLGQGKTLFQTVNGFNLLLVLGVCFILLIAWVSYGFPSNGIKLLAQAILFLFIGEVVINTKEERLIKNIYVIAMLIYSILVIFSCLNDSTRYYHGNIMLFGTSFDPNYIGIPFTAAACYSLYDFIHEKKRIVYGVEFGILCVAIVLTASRGNFIGLLLGSILVIWFYFKEKKISVQKRIARLMLLMLLLVILIWSFAYFFPDQWNRMTSISMSEDNGRFDLWNNAFIAWKESPILGVGLGGIYRIYHRATHNTYMQILSETGVIGSIVFIVFVASHIKRLIKVEKKVYFCIAIAMMIQILFLDALDNRGVWTIMCMLVLAENSVCNQRYID